MVVRRWGPERQVNATPAGDQLQPDLAALADGGYVVVWADLADALAPAIRFQRFDAAGDPSGPEGAVPAPGPLTEPSVAALPGGGFVIGAELAVAEGDHDTIAALFDASGAPAGTVAIDAARGSSAAEPSLASLGGGFVALSEVGGDLVARRYDAAGALTDEIAANATGTGLQNLSDVTGLALGGFAAVWTDQNLGRVQARVFGPDGLPVTSEDIQVNVTSLGGNPGTAGVAGLANGGFAVVWESDVSPYPSSAPDIRARLFDANGNPLGPDVLVNATTLGAQRLPEVVALRAGGFAVVWVDLAGTPALRGQIFDPFGARQGGEFIVSTTALDPGAAPEDLSIAELADGRLVVAWRAPDGDGGGVMHQILDPRDGVVNGGAGEDLLHGSDAWGDEVNGFGGDDRLIGLRGDDVLFGGDGGDVLLGGRGEDMLHGGRDDDRLIGGAGGDDLLGGAGRDVASYEDGGAVTVALDGSLDGTGRAAGDVFAGLEDLLGSGAGDWLRGDAGANGLGGGGGNDRLEGLDGDDSLDGGDGDDTLLGGVGADRLDGGAGFDIASYAGSSGVTVALDGSLPATGEAAGDSFAGIEGLAGSARADRLRGDEGANRLDGGAGADKLEGAGGQDSLTGGTGQDTLIGGAGADAFVFAAAADSAPGAARDRIADFAARQDRLALSAIDANAGAPGNQAFVLDADGSFSAGEIRQSRSGGNLLVEMNLDADSPAEMSVLLLGVTAPLAAADLLL